ncbi:MAG: hypothetical protein KDI09_15855 [Halioglobus sp.]|nr:hypothetical protein [Halioglobus sp.]
MRTDKHADNRVPAATRIDLLRDIGVLQLKLIVDGIRDFVLVPLSLIAGAIGLLSGGREAGQAFYDLLRYAKLSERWINLFGAVDRLDTPDSEVEQDTGVDLDRMVSRFEDFVRAEYHDGHITAQAREKLDRAIARLQKATRRGS